MPVLFVEFVGPLIRWALSNVFGYMVLHHIYTPAQADKFILALTGSGLTLLWQLWAHRDQVKQLLTALARTTPSTVQDNKIIAKFKAPALTTPTNEVPKLK